jgi:hypothetical protein
MINELGICVFLKRIAGSPFAKPGMKEQLHPRFTYSYSLFLSSNPSLVLFRYLASSHDRYALALE